MLQQYVEERSITPLALNYDFALITLSSPAPEGTSYLDIAAGEGTERFDLTTAGYPADKSGQDMWAVSAPIGSKGIGLKGVADMNANSRKRRHEPRASWQTFWQYLMIWKLHVIHPFLGHFFLLCVPVAANS